MIAYMTTTPINLSDQLLEQCAKGDEKSHYLLYRMCYNTIRSICVRYTKVDEEIRSYHNLAFMKVLQHLHQYRTEVSFEYWVRRVSINVIIDEFRKQQREREKVSYHDFTMQPLSENVDYNAGETAFDTEQLEQFIHQLAPMTQKVFNLFAIDGYSHKEIATLLNMSEGTSKWHLSSARENLKKMILKSTQQKKVEAK